MSTCLELVQINFSQFVGLSHPLRWCLLNDFICSPSGLSYGSLGVFYYRVFGGVQLLAFTLVCFDSMCPYCRYWVVFSSFLYVVLKLLCCLLALKKK